jgi:hypothetical protein
VKLRDMWAGMSRDEKAITLIAWSVLALIGYQPATILATMLAAFVFPTWVAGRLAKRAPTAVHSEAP